MSHTESRPAFRLPWTADRTESDTAAVEASQARSAAHGAETEETEELVTPDSSDVTAGTPARRPTKFMADLSRAMQAAAEGSRDETLARLGADAKTAIEGIQAASTVEAAALRRRADDDIAAVREWSKAEIARIREETEARIATRKTALDAEVDAHAATVDVRAQRVTAAVAAFESEMAEFFERLAAEEDPTRIATMAETMPDPPDLEVVAASVSGSPDPVAVRLAAWAAPEPETVGAERVEAAVENVEAGDAEGATRSAAPATSDFEAAEAEAAAFTGDLGDDGAAATALDAEPASPDAASAPAVDAGSSPSGTRTTTRVVVLGLVSVASIATFKRTLGRSPGVSAIGVASGPDGEFVFTVDHDAHMSLGEAIVALPGFEARIVASTATQLEVAAHDPDTGD